MTGSSQRRWRVASANGFLLGCYLVPAWFAVAWKIWTAPVRGLFDTATLAPAIFASDVLRLAPVDMLRFAYLVALAKFTVVIFFVAFAVFSLSSVRREQEEGDELLHIGLALAAVVSTASMVLAYWLGEAEAIRLHATETLMILSAVIVAIVDAPSPQGANDATADIALAERLETAGQPATEKSPAAI